MGFFDEDSAESIYHSRGPHRDTRPWDGPPLEIQGGWIPWNIVIGRSENVVLLARDFEAFHTGLQFELHARYRKSRSADRRSGVGSSLVKGLGTPGGLQLGIGFSDGRKAIGRGVPVLDIDGSPHLPVLIMLGGMGSANEHRLRFWLWPLPSSGDIAVASLWPEAEIPETVTVVDGSSIESAAARAEILWRD